MNPLLLVPVLATTIARRRGRNPRNRLVEEFTESARRWIADEIREAERHTSGEIRVMIKARCDSDLVGRVYDQAIREFEKQGMTKTADRTGVLILIVAEERRLAIVGDTGIHAKLGDSYWNQRIAVLVSAFKNGDYVRGIVAVVQDVGRELAEYFPRKQEDTDELPNEPIVESGQ